MSKVWGTPTWYFLHTFIEQMKEECYTRNRKEVFEIIQRICTNLPCQDCSAHARQYWKRLTANNFHTKDHMKQFLFAFHNNVNNRLGKPIFQNYDMYKSGRLEPIYQQFRHIYTTNRGFIKNFHLQFLRNNIIKTVDDFLHKHSNEFRWI